MTVKQQKTIEQQFVDISQELFGWNYGTIHPRKYIDKLKKLIDKAYAEGVRSERERIEKWLYDNGITHKKSFIALKNQLREKL